MTRLPSREQLERWLSYRGFRNTPEAIDANRRLKAYGAAIVPLLTQIIRERDYYTIDAIETLVYLEADSAAPVLMEILENSKSFIWEEMTASAAWALGKLQISEAVPILIKYANENIQENRAAAIEALGNIGDARAISALESFQGDKTFLNRIEYETYWLYRRYRKRRVSDFAREALEQIEALVPYEGENACIQCLGWKRIDSEEQLSWKYWEKYLEQSKDAIRTGLITPLECPHCNGTGVEPEAG